LDIEKATEKGGFGHYEKVTQIKADYPGNVPDLLV
jgi:hypothetical protein